jgi:hypothetical protein
MKFHPMDASISELPSFILARSTEANIQNKEERPAGGIGGIKMCFIICSLFNNAFSVT